MNKQERNMRDSKVFDFINLNPCNEDRTALIERAARRFKISTAHIYRIIKKQAFDKSIKQ